MYFKVLELCMNFYLKHDFFLMYFKIPYGFTILRSVFTIQVYFIFSVPCQKYIFSNLTSQYKKIYSLKGKLGRIHASTYQDKEQVSNCTSIGLHDNIEGNKKHKTTACITISLLQNQQKNKWCYGKKNELCLIYGEK
jgi:hypothetical protein